MNLPSSTDAFLRMLDKSDYSVYTDFIEQTKCLNITLLNGVMEMEMENGNKSCCLPMEETCCCKVESVVSIDGRGQMVLPKELRDKAKIGAGDKLAVISWEKGGELCCIALIKAENFTEMVKGQIGPMMKEVVGG